MASKRELEALIVLAGKVDPTLIKALKKAQGDTTKTSSSMQKLSAATNKFMGNVVKSAAVVGIGIAACLSVVAKEGIELASELAEVQNVVDVAFGKSSDKINSWAQTALNGYGLSELQAKKFSGTLGAMLKSSGFTGKSLITMSENLSGLAGDFASFYNLDPEEAFNKIRAGISGETEPLKQLGINMSVANLEAYALSKGIKTSYQKMDQASQSALRYAYLMEVSKDAQGDFIRTQGSFANQSRLLKTNLQQLAAKIMSTTLPALAELGEKANAFISNIANSPEKIQRIQAAVMSLGDKIGVVIDFAVKVYSFISSNWNVIEPLIWGIVGAIVAWKVASMGMAAYKGIMLGYTAATEAASWAQKNLTLAKMKDLVATAYLKALYIKDAIVKGASTVATWAMTAATSAWTIATTIATVAGSAFAAVIAFITSPIGLVILAIGALIAIGVLLYKNWERITTAVKNAWNWFVNIIKGMPDFTFALAGPLAPLLLMIKHFDKIKEAASGAINSVKKFFGIGNNEGPQISVGKRQSIIASGMRPYALGGIANEPSIFGEAGPEMAIPIRRTPRSLSLLNQTAQMLGVGGERKGSNPTFIFSPNYGSGSVSQGEAKQHYEDFKAMCEDWWDSKRRESFA